MRVEWISITERQPPADEPLFLLIDGYVPAVGQVSGDPLWPQWDVWTHDGFGLHGSEVGITHWSLP